ncbi:MAG: GNAT family N-acetyltransferase [Fimbriimonas sp.]
MIDLETACQVFCDGFSFTKSFTHPYLVSREGPLFVMHDGPRRKPDYRRAEFISPGLPVEDVLDHVERLRQQPATQRFLLCAITTGSDVCENTKAAYKGRGFRLMMTEPMMVAKAAMAPILTSAATVYRVTDQENADRVAKAAGSKQVMATQLTDDPPILRLYAADVDGEPVGWVRSIQQHPNLAWVSNMYVKPEFRRQGIAKALLSTLLQDDARHGVEHSVLLASHTGAKLYPALGYEQIAMLHGFNPVRAR